MVNFCKGCDVHKFLLKKLWGCSISIAKRWPKMKVDIWISNCLVNIKQGSDCKCNNSNYQALQAFVIKCNVHKLLILYYIMYFNSFIN